MYWMCAVNEALPQVQAVELACTKSLLEVFESINDTRKARGQIYPLASMLALIVVALMSGCCNLSQVFHYGKSRKNLLKRLGFRPPKRPNQPSKRGKLRCPNEDTLANTLASIDQQELNVALGQWAGLALVQQGKALGSIDGKALRGSGDYVLSVFIHQLHQVAWQQEVILEENNELSTLRPVIAQMLKQFPGLDLLTLDAGLCYKEIAHEIVEAKRHYLMQLKASHGTDYEQAGQAFEQITSRRQAEAQSLEKRGAQMGRSW